MSDAALTRALVSKAYDEAADLYDKVYTSPADLAENDVIFSLARSLIQPSDLILDVGCGTGLALDHLRLSPYRYTGIDLSLRMLSKAKRRYPAHDFILGDILENRLPARFYDVVIGPFGLLGHIIPSELPAFVDAIDRVMAPGGRFLIMGMTRPRNPLIFKAAGLVVPVHGYDAAALTATFSTRFSSVLVQGFRGYTPLPDRLPRSLSRVAISLETTTLGTAFPNRGRDLIVTGRKPDA